MEDLKALAKWNSDYDFLFVADTPVCAHCHHYNLFIDKTVNDALGVGNGTELRTDSALEFYYPLLKKACDQLALESPTERLGFATELFAAWGHGRLDLTQLNEEGGKALGHDLHYSYTWREKFGDSEERYYPADAVAAGYAAAALAVAYDSDPKGVEVQETQCLAQGHDHCEFELTIGEGSGTFPASINEELTLQVMPESFGGKYEEKVTELTGGLREFLGGVAGDERGLIEAFGVFVTFNPVNFYNRLSYEMLQTLRQRHVSFARVSAGLLREAGRMCGFNTFGGIIGSPEWEALTGTAERDMLTVALHSCVIARGLGFGSWSVADYDPGNLLVLQAPSTYEGPYYRLRHGVGPDPSCYLFEGACEAIAQLGHAVDWSSEPAFTPGFYDEIFSSGNNPWRAEQTHCVCRGDGHCEVAVTRQ